MNKKLQELKQRAAGLSYEATRVNREINEFSTPAPLFFWDEHGVQELYVVNCGQYISINSNMTTTGAGNPGTLKIDADENPDKVFELSVGEVRQILDYIKELVKSR